MNRFATTPKAFNVDNPVQAKRSSGWKDIFLSSPTPLGVELRMESYVQNDALHL